MNTAALVAVGVCLLTACQDTLPDAPRPTVSTETANAVAITDGTARVSEGREPVDARAVSTAAAATSSAARPALSSNPEHTSAVRSGPTVRRYAAGTPRTIGELRNQKRHGVWLELHPNGQLAEHASYVSGRLQGVRRRFFAGGRMSFEANYKDGKPDGAWNAYYDNAASQPALVAEMHGGRLSTFNGYLPDGTAWENDSGLRKCIGSNSCTLELQRLDPDALPPVVAGPCVYKGEQSIPRRQWSGLLQAVQAAWLPDAPTDDSYMGPAGCVNALSIVCAPDLDGAPGAEFLVKVRYRVANTCAAARTSSRGQTSALVAVSQSMDRDGTWRGLGLIGYQSLDVPGVESPFPTTITGFVRLPSGTNGVRTCQSLAHDRCYGSGVEQIEVWTAGGMKPMILRTTSD